MRHGAMQNKVLKKWTSIQALKKWTSISMPDQGLHCFKREIPDFKEQSRIKKATKYFHTHAHFDLGV
jgi:hypothetical protein